MSDLQNIILSIIIAVTTLWITDKFCIIFFKRKKASFTTVLSQVAFVCFHFFFSLNRGDIHILLALANLLSFFPFTILGYESRGRRKYLFILLYYALFSLSELLVFFLIGHLPMKKENLDILGTFATQTLMIIFVYELSIFWPKKSSSIIPNKYYSLLLFIPAGSLFIAIYEFYSKANVLLSIIIISVLLFINIIIFELYTKLNDFFVLEHEKSIYAQQLEIVSKNTAEQEKMMNTFHEEKHNLINELIVLKSCMEQGKKEKAFRTINKIIHTCQSAEAISRSGNSTVDALINFKYNVAKEYDIRFCLKLFLPEELPIEPCDIGILLGNSLDNAIEATKKCEKSEKKISLCMGVKKNALVMSIENPYESVLKTDAEGNYLSTKSNASRHGIGLSSIRKVAEKYQGDSVLQSGNHIFSLTVVMNLGDF